MIICNRCGAANLDEELVCMECGRKLQSGIHGAGVEQKNAETRGPLSPMRVQPSSAMLRRLLLKGLEAWVYALILGAAGVFAVITGKWQALAPAVAFIGLVAWTRKV
ncbi:MAG TPA: zinc ribbon domain-containing protein [Desulfovibrio sp.]|jgi:DNA-directed RNA polymerase subunit RPC12/RpoP|uniref:zinc ribbon domain-containing protein n=1 Tax=Desulfovibrio TaxID=872 RepID=UPI00042A438C|nr:MULTISPECIES: zinc ribbon domain-containing protein [Desulfovibrio]MDY0306504.1 zinc ribbon domain-containing protein [Desulfovibrionaceae bacterium]HMM38228.1 zinc ribbon domain-containing protein [Desulfovibrio sp.]